MKKIKISNISLDQQTWFKNGFNKLYVGRAPYGISNINDPRLWTIGNWMPSGLLDTSVETFVSINNGINIPVIPGRKLTYESDIDFAGLLDLVYCEFSSSGTLVVRKYGLLKTETMTINANTSFIRISIGGVNSPFPLDLNLPSRVGLRFKIAP